jgi:outer membrane protein OmpA-like peptidoglycan-associated protein
MIRIILSSLWALAPAVAIAAGDFSQAVVPEESNTVTVPVHVEQIVSERASIYDWSRRGALWMVTEEAPAPVYLPGEEPRSVITVNGSVHFRSGSSRPVDASPLEEILGEAQGDGAEVSVMGHTDSAGPASYNLRLSDRRAVSVKNWFAKNGVDEGKIKTDGKGEAAPLESNRTKAGRAKNRRVEVTVKREVVNAGN